MVGDSIMMDADVPDAAGKQRAMGQRKGWLLSRRNPKERGRQELGERSSTTVQVLCGRRLFRGGI